MIIRLATTALAVFMFLGSPAACSGPPTPTASPDLEERTVTPEQHWRVYATEDQLETISRLWGTNITFSEFLESVSPEVAAELPLALQISRVRVPWPTRTVDWNMPFSYGYNVSVAENKSKDSGADGSPITPGTYSLFYYVGKEHMESLPSTSTPDQKKRYFFVSIYTGE